MSCECWLVFFILEVDLQQFRYVKAAEEAQCALVLPGLHEVLQGILLAFESEEDVAKLARSALLRLAAFLLRCCIRLRCDERLIKFRKLGKVFCFCLLL